METKRVVPHLENCYRNVQRDTTNWKSSTKRFHCSRTSWRSLKRSREQTGSCFSSCVLFLLLKISTVVATLVGACSVWSRIITNPAWVCVHACRAVDVDSRIFFFFCFGIIRVKSWRSGFLLLSECLWRSSPQVKIPGPLLVKGHHLWLGGEGHQNFKADGRSAGGRWDRNTGTEVEGHEFRPPNARLQI